MTFLADGELRQQRVAQEAQFPRAIPTISRGARRVPKKAEIVKWWPIIKAANIKLLRAQFAECS